MKIIKEGLFYDYLKEEYVNSVSIKISSGCDRECSFCTVPLLEGKEVRFTPVVELKQNLLDLWENGVRHLDFFDDNFLLYAEEMGKVLAFLSEKGCNFSFSLLSPVKVLLKNQKHLISFRQQGLRCVTLNLINSNQDVLNRYGIKETLKDQIYAIQILQALRCQIHFQYILFDPLTTIDHLHNDLVFLEKNKLFGLVPYTDILTTYLDLEKDSPISQEYHSRSLYLPSSDPYVPYRIMEKEAQEVFHWLIVFDQLYGKRWNEMHKNFSQLRMKLKEIRPDWVITNMGQELLHIIYDLRIIPYEFFRALINCADEGKIFTLNKEEMVKQLEERFESVELNSSQYRNYHNL